MNYLSKPLVGRVLLLVACFFVTSSQSTFAQTAPSLGAAESFGVLAGTSVTATGPTVISGNVGVSPGTGVSGFPPALVLNGSIFAGISSAAGPAKAAAVSAYNNLALQACIPANNLTGKILGQTPGAIVLNPGVYCFDAAAQLNGTLTLNDAGNPNAVFIFKIGTTLTTNSGGQVVMSSGGSGSKVFWQIGDSVTIGTGTTLRGNVLANTNVTINPNAGTTGRVIAINGTATINTASVEALLTGYQFSSPVYSVSEGSQTVDLTVTRTGDTSGPGTVLLQTSDSAGAVDCNVVTGVVASSRCDYEIRIKTLRFAPGETSKTVSIFIIDDGYVELPEAFEVTLSDPTDGGLGLQASTVVTINDNLTPIGTNPIDTTNFFVYMHYLDFLNRIPDPDGYAFWTNEIAVCGNTQQCIGDRRVNVSAAFYMSTEFQNTGYLIERLYKTAYGDATGTSTLGGAHQLEVPIVRLREFLHDTQEIGENVVVNQPGWETVLENNKQALVADFVQRSRFTDAYPASMTPAQFVDTLNANADGPLSPAERDQLVSDLTSGAKTRAQVLRAVAEDTDLQRTEFNRAFVLMQYFGYLRRNPDDPQDTDYTGYDFWLTKLNDFGGNYQTAEMVKAFITSTEYRHRFGQ